MPGTCWPTPASPTPRCPVSYMNCSAAIKAFTGQHGGTICTSSNAERALEWAFERGERVLFLPDQHLGRNTAVLRAGHPAGRLRRLRPAPSERRPDRRAAAQRQDDALEGPLLGPRPLHAGLASSEVRERIPGVNVLVHPECQHEVVAAADLVGSHRVHHQDARRGPAGSAVGRRHRAEPGPPARAHPPDKTIAFLDRTVCFCSTMNRIDLPHLVWALEYLVEGRVVNRIEVDPDVAHWARVALDRMLALPARVLDRRGIEARVRRPFSRAEWHEARTVSRG